MELVTIILTALVSGLVGWYTHMAKSRFDDRLSIRRVYLEKRLSLYGDIEAELTQATLANRAGNPGPHLGRVQVLLNGPGHVLAPGEAQPLLDWLQLIGAVSASEREPYLDAMREAVMRFASLVPQFKLKRLRHGHQVEMLLEGAAFENALRACVEQAERVKEKID